MLNNMEIDSFYEKFLSIRNEHEAGKMFFLKSILESAERISNILEHSKKAIADYIETESPHYNVFRIIGLDRKEVGTHTPFLADLLSSKAGHGQGKLFLRNFLINVLGFNMEIADHPSWEVVKEKEYIDLRLLNKKLQMAVFIENKFGTGAHDGQLSSYYEMWKKYENGGRFIYLTRFGDKPGSGGFISPSSEKEILKILTCLSYKKDIVDWIESCLMEVKSKKVYYSLKQYIEIIE
jgi:hypothetical protein